MTKFRNCDFQRTNAMPFINNPAFVSGCKQFDQYCRRKEVEMLETELNNALFKIKHLGIALRRAEKAAEIYRKKAYEFATSTSAENLESEREANHLLTKEVQELKKENKALQEKVNTLILLEKVYKNG